MSISSHKANLALLQIEGLVNTQLDFIVVKTAAHEVKWVSGIKSVYVLRVDMKDNLHFEQVYDEDCLLDAYENGTVEECAGILIKKILKNREKQLTNKK